MSVLQVPAQSLVDKCSEFESFAGKLPGLEQVPVVLLHLVDVVGVKSCRGSGGCLCSCRAALFSLHAPTL